MSYKILDSEYVENLITLNDKFQVRLRRFVTQVEDVHCLFLHNAGKKTLQNSL